MRETRLKRRPPIGKRVMRPYGRVNYAEYGELGTVTAHNDDGTFQMTLDAEQPFHREMWGAKSKLTDHGGKVHERLNPSEVGSAVTIYRENAKRLRRVANAWAAEADHQRRVEDGKEDA